MKKLTNHQRQRIAIAAEIAAYALDWIKPVQGAEIGNGEALEAIAHQLACCITQWVTHDSVGTSETWEFLRLDTYPNKHQLEERMLEYITALSGT